jgi:plastocyanin
VTIPARLAVLIATSGIVLVLPTAAEARTKTVDMGLPLRAQEEFNEKYGADVHDFFPHKVTIRAGDSVRFRPTGFHTVDIPPKGGGPVPLFSPTGQKVAGVNDAAGVPFWFNGQDQLGFTPELLASGFGKRFTYRGTRRVESGVPLGENVKPMRVRFPKRGTHRYYCDVHPGMKGSVVVRRKGATVPSRKQDRRRVRKQLRRARQRAKTLAATTPPANTVYTGASARGGVEYFGMLPASITVPLGRTVRFQMSPGSFDAHTATFGPGDPQREPNSYLGQIAASFQGANLDPRGVYPSERPGTTGVLTPALHGNGFWNTGVMDTASASPPAAFNVVTFGAPGTYTFYCLIHPFMRGTVTVQ